MVLFRFPDPGEAGDVIPEVDIVVSSVLFES